MLRKVKGSRNQNKGRKMMVTLLVIKKMNKILVITRVVSKMKLR